MVGYQKISCSIVTIARALDTHSNGCSFISTNTHDSQTKFLKSVSHVHQTKISDIISIDQKGQKVVLASPPKTFCKTIK